jgi:UDP-N-acetylmuramoylalanine--D-glutamate ligase
MKLFKDKKIVIMGLGLRGGGVGAAKFFYKQGAKLLITDLRSRKELKPSLEKLKGLQINFILGKHRKQDFIDADLIIRNPGVPRESLYLKIAKENNIPVKTDIDIFFDLCPGEIIGITGTKGKSTTATLIYLLLKKKYPYVVLAGNIGISPLEILNKINKKTKVVLELSSFELENLKKSPRVAVITTLFPDHLNRYESFKDYIKAKKSIFKYQNKKDILILNQDNPDTKRLSFEAKSKVYFFKGSNQSAAVLTAKLFKIPDKQIESALFEFKGVPNRQEIIAVKRGVKYINDTTATTPESTILAIETFEERFPDSKIILIAGGEDKNLNYKGLAKTIKRKANRLILLPGTASDKIKKELGFFKFIWAESMKQAVKKASQFAQKGDIVLLSPGAASFNLFDNEFDRAKKFIEAVRKI